MTHIIEKIREELQKSADDHTRTNSQRFFKEKIRFHGVRVPTVNKIGKAFFAQISSLPKPVIFNLCEDLWQSGYIEESFIACQWSHAIRKRFETDDFRVFEKWIDHYVNNWASCDTFCNHTVGTFLEMHPDYLKPLKVWTRSGNRWMRRAAAVSLIIPARKGLFFEDMLDIANRLLVDKDDMVRKGYGWLLKVASESNQQAVFEYVMEQKEIMPRTSLRYAIEKMPAEMKALAMAR